MADNYLRNGDFEADWQETGGHRCLIFPVGGAPYQTDVGNIFTPPGWITWFKHQTGEWSQPEVRAAHAINDPRRVQAGQHAMLLFTFYRKHDAGFLQPVRVTAGERLKLTGWAHAWSNVQNGPHTDDPRWSEGPGYAAGYLAQGAPRPPDSPGSDSDWHNFTFWLGIDPRGGTDPFAASVVWGPGAHIYNQHAEVPSVEAVAQGEVVTVFLRSATMWPFKHNDAYWDSLCLTRVAAVEPPPTTEPEGVLVFEALTPQAGSSVGVVATSAVELSNVVLRVRGPDGAQVTTTGFSSDVVGGQYVWRWTFVPNVPGEYTAVFSAEGGAQKIARSRVSVAPPPATGGGGVPPRVAYARTYVLLPQDAGPEWVQAILQSGKWAQHRWTIGGSADDAGVGPQDRTVIAVNAGRWPGDLRGFFNQYYPGVRYITVDAATPNELVVKLQLL